MLWSPGHAAGELQVPKTVNEESNEEHVAQHASAICSQTHGSSPGYQEVNQKNREELKSRKINSEPWPWMRKRGEGGNAEGQDFLPVLVRKSCIPKKCAEHPPFWGKKLKFTKARRNFRL